MRFPYRKCLAVRNDSPGYGDILQALQMVPWWLKNEGYTEIWLNTPQPLFRLVQYSLSEYDPQQVRVVTNCPIGIGATETGWFKVLSERGSFKPTGDPILKVPDLATRFHIAPGKVHIGVAWSSHWRDQTSHGQMGCGRSTSPQTIIEPLLDHIPHARLHCLQPDRIDEVRRFGSDIELYNFTDFYETAQLVRKLDFVVTIDSVACHLAAGLGVPTFTLISPRGATQYTSGGPGRDGWWWLGDAPTQTPWYKWMRLIRALPDCAREEHDPNGIRSAVDQFLQLDFLNYAHLFAHARA